MTSPSRIRRDGRNAFYRGGNPADHNPYTAGGFQSLKATDWLAGWEQAKREDDDRIAAEIRADQEDFDKVVEFARLYNLAKEQGLIS
ncbi:hypothetical protein IVB12_15585 [Bradyrhizobium sp. 179]|uniref:hypothetical protein n=1 Tax=Bradyrhizobium sp. 179 TaxID=2782648 RepID=UPI001FF8329D|nr:hypothetical protein [Bradyrhizobium sp. 179]MCK1543337.1 hypothetical protein [Bradyrhizobium sp. 179]